VINIGSFKKGLLKSVSKAAGGFVENVTGSEALGKGVKKGVKKGSVKKGFKKAVKESKDD
jgi:hypothetical protein